MNGCVLVGGVLPGDDPHGAVGPHDFRFGSRTQRACRREGRVDRRLGGQELRPRSPDDVALGPPERLARRRVGHRDDAAVIEGDDHRAGQAEVAGRAIVLGAQRTLGLALAGHVGCGEHGAGHVAVWADERLVDQREPQGGVVGPPAERDLLADRPPLAQRDAARGGVVGGQRHLRGRREPVPGQRADHLVGPRGAGHAGCGGVGRDDPPVGLLHDDAFGEDAEDGAVELLRVLEARSGFPQLGDVHHDPELLPGDARDRRLGLVAIDHPPNRPVPRAHAVGAVEGAAVGELAVDRRLVGRPVVGVDQRPPQVLVGVELLGPIAGQLLGLRAQPPHGGHLVEVADVRDQRDALDEAAVALLGLGQAAHRPFPRRHVADDGHGCRDAAGLVADRCDAQVAPPRRPVRAPGLQQRMPGPAPAQPVAQAREVGIVGVQPEQLRGSRADRLLGRDACQRGDARRARDHASVAVPVVHHHGGAGGVERHLAPVGKRAVGCIGDRLGDPVAHLVDEGAGRRAEAPQLAADQFDRAHAGAVGLEREADRLGAPGGGQAECARIVGHQRSGGRNAPAKRPLCRPSGGRGVRMGRQQRPVALLGPPGERREIAGARVRRPDHRCRGADALGQVAREGADQGTIRGLRSGGRPAGGRPPGRASVTPFFHVPSVSA